MCMCVCLCVYVHVCASVMIPLIEVPTHYKALVVNLPGVCVCVHVCVRMCMCVSLLHREKGHRSDVNSW